MLLNAIQEPLSAAKSGLKAAQLAQPGVQGAGILATALSAAYNSGAGGYVFNTFGTTITVVAGSGVGGAALAGATNAIASAAATKSPVAFVGAVDSILLYGVVKEGYAAATGACHP